jgi:hypothetical protein
MRQFCTSVIFLFIVAVAYVQCQSTSFRLSDAVVPKIYDLFIQVDVDFYSFSGNVTIDVEVKRATSTIELHAINMTITNNTALVNSGEDVQFKSVYMLYNNESEIVTIGLDRILAANTNHSITLWFSGRIEYDMKGLYMSTYYERNVK